jgi:hypothetical protein
LVGFALPVVIVLSGFIDFGSVLDSLSDYIGARNKEVSVVMLLIVAWCLIKYKGYDFIDNFVGKLAGLFALGVLFFPNSTGGWQSVVHFVSATGLFLVFAFMCLFLFTKTKDSPPNNLWHTITSFRFGLIRSDEPGMERKKIRNKVYVACGISMLISMLVTILYNLFWQDTGMSVIKPVLMFEWLMIWAFAIAWMVKGQIILSDRRVRVEI